jgi:diguanylate cyclase (GGDEF)-like protein
MIKKGFKRNSIMVRLLFSMLAVLLIQTFLFAGNIWYGGTIEELNNNSVDLLEKRVFSRKNYLQNEMIQRWSNLSKFEHDIQTAMDSYLEEKEITLSTLKQEPHLAFEFLERTVDHTIFVLRQRMVTGAFIVLTGENGKEHPGVYIRDLDPLFNPADNSDLSMEIGPSAVARKADISLGMGWSPRFTLSQEDDSAAFYYKPFLAAQENWSNDISDLGYWSRPFMLSEYGFEAITYSVPLLDIEGNPYGVIGIDLTLDYLRKMLYYDEIADNKQGAYLLAISHEDDMVFENVISSGPMFNKYFGDSTKTVLDGNIKYENIYKIKQGKNNMDTVYGCVHYLDLYNSSTPFEKDRWALIGIVEEPILFRPARQIMLYVVISLFLSFIAGMVGVVLAGMWFVKPITKLVGNLRSSNPEKTIVLAKTNIAEIDDLAWSIEILSSKVADSAAKLSKIIGMMEIPIGAFEHNSKEDRVFCTAAFFDLAGIKRTKEDTEYISSTYFYEILQDLKKHPEPDMEDIYRYEKDEGSVKWLRIKIQESSGKTLGLVEDVTREAKEKRKIEYERDHDLLTHLLNRRAFQAEVTKRLREEDVKTAAFIMWDLDNLKYINDTYGHDFGDQYIKDAAKTLSELAIYNGIVARMSGDEFYAFIYGYEDKKQIKEIVEMTQEKLYNTTIKMPNGTDLRIRASVGIAWYPEDSKNYHELIKYSDFAMYEVKNEGKGTIGEFDKESYEKQYFLLHGKEELDYFIEEELADFVFQPIVDIQKGSVFAYEALMRPKIPTLTSPEDIIKLADSQTKLYDIERITWFKAMEAFQRQRKAFGDAKIFINSVANHVLSDRDLQRFEEKYKWDLHRIIIEIIENEQANEQIIKKKQEMAARWNSYLALDDFGSGYNSEIILLALSPAFVKLDMTIIRGIDRDLNRQKLLKTLVAYIKDRQIKTIAEGVETKAEMDTLIEFGVDYLQGYYIGKPNMIPQKISPKIVSEICEKTIHI